jgi:hypothetical protein
MINLKLRALARFIDLGYILAQRRRDECVEWTVEYLKLLQNYGGFVGRFRRELRHERVDVGQREPPHPALSPEGERGLGTVVRRRHRRGLAALFEAGDAAFLAGGAAFGHVGESVAVVGFAEIDLFAVVVEGFAFLPGENAHELKEEGGTDVGGDNGFEARRLMVSMPALSISSSWPL